MANTAQGLRGLTFESALATNPGIVGRLDSLRETGTVDYGNEPETRFRQYLRDVDSEGELLSQMVNWRPSRNQRMLSQRQALLSSDAEEDIGLEAAAAGYGESRFDRRMTNPAQLNDIEDFRSRQQTGLGVFANSLMKMGVLAGTTAADSWVGIPAGLINLTTETVRGNVTSGMDVLNALISNPVSKYLQGINDKSEEVFSNYMTSEERNRPWWENMFTANFIGDTLIKNAGFTIGAVVGGKGVVNVLGKASGVREARDAFKGLAAELGLAGKSASEVVEILAKGTTSLEKKAAVKALSESARKLKDAELALKIAGGLVAGTGEARIEAINGANELERSYEELYGNIDLSRADALERVKADLAARGIAPDSPEWLDQYNRQKEIIDRNFMDLREQIAHDKAMAANTIFALNVPLLTAGDMIQWGKLMLGGYAVDRNIVKGIKKVAGRSAAKGAAKAPAELAAATRYAVRGNKFTDTLGKIGAASRNVFVEMQEEMNQSFFSATAKAKAMGNTTEFMERLYDPKAVEDTVSWLDAAKEGMRQSWLNKDDWVEGFAGGFMGFMGLPSISVRVNEKTGKQQPKITMEGGIWSPLREQSSMYKRRNELVKTLNARLSSPDFLNYYYGKIGNRHFDSIKEDAIKQGDKGLYAKADHAQLINDAMMFADAGRLQDFIDIVDSFRNVSDDTIEQIRQLFPESSEVQGMTTAGMRTVINDNAERMKRQLDSYMKIADDIRTVYGNTIDDATVAELTWQTAHLDEIEHDLKDILSHPETTSMLSQYKGEKADAVKDLTDYEIVSSGAYRKWLTDKYNDKSDMTDKAVLTAAINDAADAQYDMSERSRYIDNLSALSADLELVQKRQSRLKKQQEELRRLQQLVKASRVLSSTDKLSDFISAMEEIGRVPDETLADIKKEADKGNKTAEEYLIVRDIESDLDEQIQRIGEKAGATEEQIKQAKAAWNYFKHNSDSLYDLTRKHTAADVASDVAGEAAVNILNDAVEAVLKSRDLYKRAAKRPARKEGTETEEVTGESTKFRTTGETLTKKKYDEIVALLRKKFQTHQDAQVGGMIFKVDLDKGNVYFDGKPSKGVVYLYFKDGRPVNDSGKIVLPVVYDQNGNEIAPEDVKKLTGPKGQNFTEYLLGDDFPAYGFRIYNVLTDKLAAKWKEVLPVGRKKTSEPVKKDTVKKEKEDAGSKTSPHKYIAPNPDISLLGGDSHAVAEALKSLPEDSEVRFGILDDDGPIYILAGDSNIRIGTLPREGMDSYSGLSELSTLIRQEFEASKDRRNADGMWISDKYVNHIREKRTAGFETIDDNIPLDEIPGFEGIKEPIIMFVYDEGKSQRHVFSDAKIQLSDVQLRGNLTSGFAYLLVPSGKKYIPVMLYTQNVNATTLDLNDPAVTGKGFGKRVSDAIDKVVEAITNTNEGERTENFKWWAWNTEDSSKDSLQRLLYFRSKGKVQVQFFTKETCPQHPGWFTNDSVKMVINVHNTETGEDDWTPIRSDIETSLRDQIIDVFNKMDYQTEDGRQHTGPIVQIHPRHFDDLADIRERVRELIDSKMLLTDVRSFDMTMPSFIMDYWSVSQGKFIRPSHSPVKKSAGPKVTTRTSRSKGTEKIATVQWKGKDIQYNITSGKVKMGDGKWFSKTSHEKSDEKAIRDLGFKSFSDFIMTMKALAYIADRYGDRTTGEGRIGNRVLLRRFSGSRDAGFVITGDGGRFMTSEELVKFKDELKNAKKENDRKRREAERKRVSEASEERVIREGIKGVAEGLKEAFGKETPSRVSDLVSLMQRSDVEAAFKEYAKGATDIETFFAAARADNADNSDALKMFDLLERFKGTRSYIEKTFLHTTEEAKRMAEAAAPEEEAEKEQEDFDDEEDTLGENTFNQETTSSRTNAEEIARLETISNVREAIEHLKKFAPQYKPFLDYISGIGIYDEVLVELANIVDVNDSKTAGRNVMRFRGSEYTDRIVVGRNSMGYHTLMHELVHAFTSVALKYDNELLEDVQTLMDYFQDKVGNARLTNLLGIDGMYAFSSPYEFVAEFFSNPKLQELAKTIEVPEIQQDKKTNIFARFIHFLSEAIKRLINRGGNKTLFDKLNDTLYSVVDRQVELNETGRMVFRTKQEFDKARNLANGARVDGVAFATKIPTVEERYDYRYTSPFDEDRSVGIPELRKYPSGYGARNMAMLGISQLIDSSDAYSSLMGQRRLLGGRDVYEFNNGTASSLIGVKEGEVFVTVRAVPVMRDGSYDRLIGGVASSKMPVVIGVSESDVAYYQKLGLHPVHDSAVDGKVFMANSAFTEEDLYTLGTTYRPFAEVLDSNDRFTELRRMTYSDAEWGKFSDMEKYHARKCIGI